MSVCTRRSCSTVTEPEQRHCSAECARVDAVCQLFDALPVEAAMGRGAAVVHALPWMDVRARAAS